MGEPVKSILLVDLEGLGESLAASGGEGMDERLAERIDDWSSAIESGELLESEETLDPVGERRCYVGSASAEAARAAFERAGFEIVSCDGPARRDLCLAIDAMDAAADDDGAVTFILLTATPDLTPLVERLHDRGHRVAVYAGEATAADYRAAADMVIPAGAFAAFLAASKAQPRAVVPMSAFNRDAIETFAREVHTATNIPMFSPKTFAELFRALASEVTEHGYHFNDTAKSVAERLSGAGRNVTARQVVFVVKGLALKGHVFSTSDTAERLAEVFREQARYLIDNAGITLDAGREALLAAWIAAPAVAPAKPARQPQPAAASKPARPAQPEAESKPPVRKPTPARHPERPAAAKPAAPPRPPERPKSSILPTRAAAPPPEPAKPTSGSPDLRATITARIAASAKMKPSARPPIKAADSPPPPTRAGGAPGGSRRRDRIVDPGGDRPSRGRSGRGRRQQDQASPGTAGTRGTGGGATGTRGPAAGRPPRPARAPAAAGRTDTAGRGR